MDDTTTYTPLKAVLHYSKGEKNMPNLPIPPCVVKSSSDYHITGIDTTAHLQMADAYKDMAFLAYQKGDMEQMQTFKTGALLELAALAHKEGGTIQELHDLLTVLHRMT